MFAGAGASSGLGPAKLRTHDGRRSSRARSHHHQPLFRTAVLRAYERRCAVCKLPFAELLDAAHIQADSAGGAARVSNGLSLCKIHHGAFDANITGISPDYVVHVRGVRPSQPDWQRALPGADQLHLAGYERVATADRAAHIWA